MTLFSQVKAIQTTEMSFYYCRKICIFLKSISNDSGQKFQTSFQSYFCVKEAFVLLSDDVAFLKGGYVDDKKVVLLQSKICIFPKGLNHYSGQKFQLSLQPVKETPQFCRLMMLFSQKEAFQPIKMSFYFSLKLCIFPRGLTHDSGRKFRVSFKATFL